MGIGYSPIKYQTYLKGSIIKLWYWYINRSIEDNGKSRNRPNLKENVLCDKANNREKITWDNGQPEGKSKNLVVPYIIYQDKL